jgi:hypothetical protein
MTRCLLAAVLLLSGRSAFACAVCGCGDPTITALGTEKPFRNRVRTSLELRHRSDTIGKAGEDALSLSEQRLDAQVAWAPHERVFLLVTVPALRREVSYVNLRREQSFGLGDVELRAKVFVWQDREKLPQHLLGASAGVKFPTAIDQRSGRGELLPIELQAGTGSFDPILGLSYAWFRFPVMIYASVNGTYPTKGRYAFRASPSLRFTAAAQYNVTSWFAPRIGIDARLDGKGEENGTLARDSGGFLGALSFEALFTPTQDLLVFVAVRVPVIQALLGFHQEGSYLSAGIAYDFSP